MPAPTASAPPRRRGGAGGDIAELSCEDGRIATQPGPGCNARAPGTIRRPPGVGRGPAPLCGATAVRRRAGLIRGGQLRLRGSRRGRWLSQAVAVRIFTLPWIVHGSMSWTAARWFGSAAAERAGRTAPFRTGILVGIEADAEGVVGVDFLGHRRLAFAQPDRTADAERGAGAQGSR